MEIVNGQTARTGLTIDRREGTITIYQISKGKLRQFRDGGTAFGRLNDWAYLFLTSGVSFFVSWLTTDSIFARYVLAILTILSIAVSICLFISRKTKKNELFALYDEIVSGEV
jgi:hypothetical protein